MHGNNSFGVTLQTLKAGAPCLLALFPYCKQMGFWGVFHAPFHMFALCVGDFTTGGFLQASLSVLPAVSSVPVSSVVKYDVYTGTRVKQGYILN